MSPRHMLPVLGAAVLAVGSVPPAEAGKALYSVKAARQLSAQTGRPLLAIAGTTG